MSASPRSPDANLVPAAGIVKRAAADRGHANHGWLKTAFSFSFANYQDPHNVHFEALRVINDDAIAGGGGFPMHPHSDFEIFSYVLEGEIAHKDSMGNGSTVGAGGIQYMTAGSGVTHSEFNPNADQTLRLLQIWLIPAVRGATPRYEVRELTDADKRGRFALFISTDGREGSIKTLADAEVYAGRFDGEERGEIEVPVGRRGYLHMAEGRATVNGVPLERGDALKVTEPGLLEVTEGDQSEILFFDLGPLS